MHCDACRRVSAEFIDARLIDEISKLKSLTGGASAAGATVHNLPKHPKDVEDDGEFHFAVLGLRGASDSGRPSTEAKRYIDETTGPDKPRVFRNAVVLAVPSRDGVEAARNRIHDYLGWEEVRIQLKEQLKGQELDPIREGQNSANISGARSKISEAIQQAYCIVVTVSDKNEIQAFKVTPEGPSLFAKIKEDKRSRIQETPVSADALLPEGPYDLWREGENSRRLKDHAGAFALSPQLPKMLNRQAILETLVTGCKEGQFVLRAVRPDRSVRTFWRQEPDEAALKDPSLEVVLPEAAELAEIAPDLLEPDRLPSLWQSGATSFGEICNYFSGGTVAKIDKGGYEEPLTVPKVSCGALTAATAEAVKQGKVWLTSGQASILAEEIPAGFLTDDARLQAPPPPIPVTDLSADNLPEVLSDDSTAALAIAVALSKKAGTNLPWATVRKTIDGALQAGMIELTLDSPALPSSFAGAQNVKLRVRVGDEKKDKIENSAFKLRPDILVAEADLRPNEIQDLAELLPEIRKAAATSNLKFHLRLELDGLGKAPAGDAIAKLNELLMGISKQLAFNIDGPGPHTYSGIDKRIHEGKKSL